MQLQTQSTETTTIKSTMSTSTVKAEEDGKPFPGSSISSPYFCTRQSSQPMLVPEPAQQALDPGVLNYEPINISKSEATITSVSNQTDQNESPTDGIVDTAKHTDETVIGSPNTSNTGESTGLDENDVEAYRSYINNMCNAAAEMKRETNQQEPQCLVCGKTFETWKQLKRHVRIHAEFRPFKCDQCSKGFCELDKLKRHRMTHTGIKPYQCNICNQRVSRPEHLRRHMLTHMDKKPYKCSACEFTARRPERIKVHQHKCHVESTDLTVVYLDVKLPEVVTNCQIPQAGDTSDVNSPNCSSYIKGLHDLQMKAQKGRKRMESLPTMVPPNFHQLPPLDLLSGNNSTNINSDILTGDGANFGTASGPVFPGQISPRIKHLATSTQSQLTSDSSGAKRVKLENVSSAAAGSTKQHNTNRTAYGLNPNSELNNSCSSSRRKAQPRKNDPEASVPSFEGFGTTDFSSIGIPGSFVQISTSCPTTPVLDGEVMTPSGAHATLNTFGLVTFEEAPSGVLVKREPTPSPSTDTTLQLTSPKAAVQSTAATSCSTSVSQQLPSVVPLALYRNTNYN